MSVVVPSAVMPVFVLPFRFTLGCLFELFEGCFHLLFFDDHQRIIPNFDRCVARRVDIAVHFQWSSSTLLQLFRLIVLQELVNPSFAQKVALHLFGGT